MKNNRLMDLAKLLKLSIDPCKSFQYSLKQSLLKGINVMEDPIFSSILHTMQLNQFLNIKKKTRILLPESCVLIGVVDPTGTLKHNEIFVQTRRDNFSIHNSFGYQNANRANRLEHLDAINQLDSISEIIEGDVLVTRNPCVHPGDIRRLTCVDKPELRYLYNVVVFSSEGERPQCNMMSGGDLDGDIYFITWDKELLSYVKLENIEEPADYSKNEILKEKPDSEGIADYICFYLQRDVLGVVSNLWLQLSDYYGQRGPCHDDCKTLAHLCSVAVDFAKHGECVSKENFDYLQKKVEMFPDFMEREQSKTYQSTGVLGRLYRELSGDESLEQFVENDWKFSIRVEY